MQVVGLPAADIGRIGSREVEIGAEYVVAHLGIDFVQPHAIVGVLPFEGGFEACADAVDIDFVDLRFDLEVREVVDLSDLLARCDRLSQHDVQQADLAVDRRFDGEVADALADELHVAPHVGQIIFHLFDLHGAVERILYLPLDVQLALFLGQIPVLLGLQPLFAGDEPVCVEFVVLFEGAPLACHVEIELRLVLPQGELFLLHRDERVAQQVLLLGQFGFAVEDFERQRRVAQLHQHVAPADRGSLLDHEPFDDTRFERTQLNRRNGFDLSRHADVVVEIALRHFGDRERAGIDTQRRGVVAQQQPCGEEQEEHTAPIGETPFGEQDAKSFFSFDLNIHCSRLCVSGSTARRCSTPPIGF